MARRELTPGKPRPFIFASASAAPPPRQTHATARALTEHHHERDESSESLGGDGALRPLPRVAPPELPLRLLLGALLRRHPLAPLSPRPRPGPGRGWSGWRRALHDPGAQGEDRALLAGVLRRLHGRRHRQLRAHPHGRHPARPRQVQHAGEPGSGLDLRARCSRGTISRKSRADLAVLG